MTNISATRVRSSSGRQYHIGLKEGELAEYILLCGDPGRVEKVAAHFDEASAPVTHREYVTVTGKYKGMPLSVMATGIGTDNTEIALVEISQIVKKATLIRIGSCSALKKHVELGEVVISTGAVRLENTTSAYVCDGYPAVAHYETVTALVAAAQKLKIPYSVGITATAPGFYGAQGREIPPFYIRKKNLPEELEKMNVENFEMEASSLFVMSSMAGFRAGCVCAVFGNRHKDKFVDDETKKIGENRCIETGLEAIRQLFEQDQQKKR